MTGQSKIELTKVAIIPNAIIYGAQGPQRAQSERQASITVDEIKRLEEDFRGRFNDDYIPADAATRVITKSGDAFYVTQTKAEIEQKSTAALAPAAREEIAATRQSSLKKLAEKYKPVRKP